MTAVIIPINRADDAAYRCAVARATIFHAGDNWPLILDQAVILAENGDREFAQGVLAAYTAHVDKVAPAQPGMIRRAMFDTAVFIAAMAAVLIVALAQGGM
jgi:hypothetical protein